MGDISILNIFERKMRKSILSFCEDLNNTRADLYVVMARKAACFISVLEKMNMVNLQGTIISERVMDTQIDWKSINSVIIIDDVIISGTTLHETIETIKKENPQIDIKLFVLGVNKKWFNNSVLEENGQSYIQNPIRYIDNAECIRLSGDIVRLLANHPIPYNIDYPIYNTLRLNDSELQQIMTLPGWSMAEVTSFPLVSQNVFTHTYLPHKNILECCGSVYTSDFLKHSLLKVRTYGRTRNDKHNAIHSISIVPMIIMPPIAIETLDTVFNKIAGEKRDSLARILISSTSRLRFVQFILADVLARVFIQGINYLLGEYHIVEREFGSLRYLFPASAINDIIYVANHFSGEIDIPMSQMISEDIKDILPVANILDVHHTLTLPFIQMYYKEELQSRKLVLEKGVNVFAEKNYKRILGRLKRGISLTRLFGRLRDLPESLRLEFISAFLDCTIDEGIVVPIMVQERGLVYRAFRHGEDVQFGQQEERLCYEMLNSFVGRMKRKDYQRLWVEKLLVLLFQLGEGRIFEPLQTNIRAYSHIKGIEQINVASVRYYLQGPLMVRTPTNAVMSKPYLEYSDKVQWLTTLFSNDQNSPLHFNERGLYEFDTKLYNKYSIGDEEIVVDSSKSRFARSIGRIFGQLLENNQNGQKPSIDGDELVALTSSLETNNIIGALAAEINLCSNSFKSESPNGIKNTLEGIRQGIVPLKMGFERINRSAWYQALNDGQRKFVWYRNRTGYDIIYRISNEFEDDQYKDDWDEFWSENLEMRGNREKDEIIKLANTEGIWLLCVYVYYLMLEYLVMEKNNSSYKSNEHKTAIINAYENIKNFGINNLVKEIIPIISEFLNKQHTPEYIEKSIQSIYRRLITMFNRAPKILEDAEDAFNRSQIRLSTLQYYNHALYVETDNEEGMRILSNTYGTIRFRMANSTNPVFSNVLMITEDQSALRIPNHCWFVSNKMDGLRWLLQVAAETMTSLRGHSQIRQVLFPYIPTDCHIKSTESGQIYFQAFWNFTFNFIKIVTSFPFSQNQLYEITESDRNRAVNKDQNPRFKSFSPSFIDSIRTSTLNDREYKIIKYEQNMENEQLKENAQIGIITIVPEEALAVQKGFSMSPQTPKIIDKRYYDIGEYTSNGKHLKIIHLQCIKQGSVDMALAFNALTSHFDLDYVVLLGIAGSIQKDINLCDVVIGSDILYYDRRKEKEGGDIARRLEHFNMSFEMLNHIRRFELLNTAPHKASDNSWQDNFNLHICPIGTGEAVIGNPLSDIRKWLLLVNSKTGVVETEAAGFTSAFNETTDGVKDIIVVRGISDKADEKKDDKWRQPASDNAVIVLKQFIDTILYKKVL